MVEQSLWAERRDPETAEDIAFEEHWRIVSEGISERFGNMTGEDEERLHEKNRLLLGCVGSDRFGRIKGHVYEKAGEGPRPYVCTNCGGTSRNGVDDSRTFEYRPLTSEALSTGLD